MSAPDRRRSTWLWAGLGLAGSALIAYAAPAALADPVVGWWYGPPAPARGAATLLVYAGMAALGVAWLGLGRERTLPTPRALMAIAAVWILPLAFAPPLFSRDVYSYLAQGTIMHLGHSPYHDAPSVLAALHRPHVLAAVSPFWRGTTAPYGPLFLGLISLIAGAVGSHLVAGVLLTRAAGLAGAALLAAAVPRLARALGTDPRRALWLALLSPLVTLELVAAGHNDLLMAGLLAAGVACAVSGRPLTGIAVCALAGTIKVPALAGVAFIAVAWGREEPAGAPRVRFAAAAAAVTVAVLAAVTTLTGAGADWLSASLFSTPAKVRLAITPATAVGYTAAGLLHDVGVAVSARGLEGALGLGAFGLTAVAGAVLLARARVRGVAVSLGAFLLIAAAGGPAAWPWYFVWGLVLVAAAGAAQRSWPLAGAIALSAFLVKPDGVLALPRPTAPAVLAVYLLAGGAVAWQLRRTRSRAPRDAAHAEPVARPGVGGTESSAVAGA